MKLMCNIEVNSRLLSSTNLPTRRKAQRGCISIARQSVKKNDLWLLLQTPTNKQGTKYKVAHNIERVFTKFVDDGKATIRIKEPPHDLIIQCDALQLKSFLHILKLGISKKLDPSVLSVSNMNPKNLTIQKTKVVIKKKSDYPVLEGFPRTTEELYLAKLEKKSFDRQILRLQSLRILDLSENQLTSLPNELGALPNMTELYLATNRLGVSPPSKWSWMNGRNICKTLRLLDISSNSLLTLPDEIRKLSSLLTLKVGGNVLADLPQSIGSLISLKYLELQKNRLECLPGSILNLRLACLDVSGNLFHLNAQRETRRIDGVSSLIENAARVVIDKRIFYDASKVPFSLMKYLDGARYCICGKACFDTFVRAMLEFDLHLISPSITSSGHSIVPFDCYYCSPRCLMPKSRRAI